ncbi:MAG: ribosomal-protein-alanine N-acetyltransferase [Lentimonas sp.]|jgi:ribosomal-protein-alanine N-acetyltransferase
MKIHLITERLILRNLEKKDLQGMFELDSDPAVHEFLGKNPISKMSQAKETIDWVQKQYKEIGYGRWAVIEKESNEFVGWCGLKYETQVREYPYHDIGYRLKQKFWRKGYGFEAAKACLEYGIDELKLKKINASAHPDNVGSNKILQKIGLKLEGTFLHDGEEVNWYEH